MTSSTKYIGMDVHKESISVAVRNAAGKIAMEYVIETKASMTLQFVDGLRGNVHVTFEEGTWAAWLYDLLKPHVTRVLVCDPRRRYNPVISQSQFQQQRLRKASAKCKPYATSRTTGRGPLAR